jgi:hypothetical protein
MFCDADDCLHNVGVLGVILEEIGRHDPDIVSTSWLEESIVDGAYKYSTHEREATWMHGKALRRKFLSDNNVRFHPDLRVHEDSYFLGIAFALTTNNVFIPVTSYVWRYSDESITRRNNAAYTFDSIPTYVKANALALENLEERGGIDLRYKTAQFMTYMYFSLHRPEWAVPETEAYLTAVSSAVENFYARFGRYYRDCSNDILAEIYAEERRKHFVGCMETELFDDWLLRIGNAL